MFVRLYIQAYTSNVTWRYILAYSKRRQNKHHEYLLTYLLHGAESFLRS